MKKFQDTLKFKLLHRSLMFKLLAIVSVYTATRCSEDLLYCLLTSSSVHREKEGEAHEVVTHVANKLYFSCTSYIHFHTDMV